MTNERNSGIFGGIDFKCVGLYIALSVVGLMSICAATYDKESMSFFAMSNLYMKQAMWVGIAWLFAFVLMLSDSRYFHMLAYPAYAVGILLLLGTLFFGREVNGAKAWFEFGSLRVQPVEFAKIAIALAVARMMSENGFEINKPASLFKLAALILLPLGIIVAQNDTGSGIVLGSLIFVLYREGLNKWLCIPVLFVALLFVVSFIIAPTVLTLLLIFIFSLSEMMMNGEWRSRVVFLAAMFALSILIYIIQWAAGGKMLYYETLLIASGVGVAAAAIYAYRSNLRNIYLIVALYMASMLFLPMSQYFFDSILKPHQQNRILTFLGLQEDLKKTGYNVHQSKIAIGSGGFFGKGYLHGTQIQYDFVPEKHTDFIFCSIGEEWGFAGSAVVLVLLLLLIFRLMKMGDRYGEPFGRVYCYCVAAILLFHVLVNVGMTIGLMPVMGIPLPFISYGGSSFVAFTILLFVAINLDASTRRLELGR
ncbi:MAG: rod shape-determining protein RodA [Alistipes sp.]|nr:rod shape-determining protein RodA [Alistipes sp.]